MDLIEVGSPASHISDLTVCKGYSKTGPRSFSRETLMISLTWLLGTGPTPENSALEGGPSEDFFDVSPGFWAGGLSIDSLTRLSSAALSWAPYALLESARIVSTERGRPVPV